MNATFFNAGAKTAVATVLAAKAAKAHTITGLAATKRAALSTKTASTSFFAGLKAGFAAAK